MRSPLSFACVLASGLALVATTSGCSMVKKANECKALVDTINGGEAQADAIGKSKGGTEATVIVNLRRVADALDKVAADASKVTITTPELKKHADDYVTLAKRRAQAARDFAAAVEAKDAQRGRAIEKEFDKLNDEEGKLVDAMNKTCNG